MAGLRVIKSVASNEKRRRRVQCSFCGQNLAADSFYKHKKLHKKQGKVKMLEIEEVSVIDSVVNDVVTIQGADIGYKVAPGRRPRGVTIEEVEHKIRERFTNRDLEYGNVDLDYATAISMEYFGIYDRHYWMKVFERRKTKNPEINTKTVNINGKEQTIDELEWLRLGMHEHLIPKNQKPAEGVYKMMTELYNEWRLNDNNKGKKIHYAKPVRYDKIKHD